MPKIIYNGNGSTAGLVPTDSTTYNPGDTYTAAQPGSLTKGSQPYFYWNTKADGTGSFIGAGGTATFPNQATDLTLFAIWGVNTGLTGGGVTTHFTFYYDPVLGTGAGAVEPARTNEILATVGSKPVIENDFDWLQAQFAGVDMTKARPFPIPVQITGVPGGGSYGASWWPLVMNADRAASSLLRCMMIAEISETFMAAQHKGWGYSNGIGNEESCGEALSLFLTVQFQLQKGLGTTWFMNRTSEEWLNTALPPGTPGSTQVDGSGTNWGSRVDYIGAVKPFAGNGPATGACMAFLYYLFHQLQFTSIPAIVAAAPGVDSSGNVIGGSCLKGVYANLTGDSSDPFPYFANLLAAAYPTNQVATFAGPNFDDPFPIGTLSFVGVKNVWGKDEITDIINTGGTFTDGFYLALDGFSLDVLGSTKPKVPTIAFTGASAALSAKTPDVYHQSENTKVPQQILFGYDVKFANPLGAFPLTGETPAAVTSQIKVLGDTMSAATEFFFVAGAAPYFTNVVPSDPAHPDQLNAPWLSEDLRVFTATPSLSNAAQTPVPGGPQFVENSSGGNFDTAGAYTYIQALLKYLNQNFSRQGSTDPFDPASNLIPGQAGQLQADSSVTPFTTIGTTKHNNYSFAIARVRLRGVAGTTSAANVKVFFRLWGTQTADTGWDPNGTYLSQKDSGNNPIWPKAPADDHTIPFFATSQQPNFNDPNDPEYKAGGSTGTGANNQTIAIATGDTEWAYFGCYLDVNDPSNVVNGTPIWQAFPGTHHCLVAEIAYAGTPIEVAGGVTPTPEGSVLLAQRNLQVTTSDNPGPASAHRVPQTFMVKPTRVVPKTGPYAGHPDEMVIFWGNTPVGSTAQIYWPGVSADEVVALADRMYGVHTLTAADPHTVEVTSVKGVSFVPIPVGAGPVYAGLFTIDLPRTVRVGQEYDVVVRRINKRLRSAREFYKFDKEYSGRTRSIEVEAAEPRAEVENPEMVNEDHGVWERYVVGSFQVKIPVSIGPVMRPTEETTLAILKARLDGWSHTDRWYPVLLRYVDYLEGRLTGIGGDPGAIPPSLGGYTPGELSGRHGTPGDHDGDHDRDDERGERRRGLTGKITMLRYDRFGDFRGFVLDTEDGERRFAAREPEIERIARRAWAERILVTVVVEEDAPTRPEEIILHSPPLPILS
ncbi:MAG TPA: hypothetical protein VJ872_18760 [Nocardioides sp.]|nr:hypothetical protein [Nocardioides sp.]